MPIRRSGELLARLRHGSRQTVEDAKNVVPEAIVGGATATGRTIGKHGFSRVDPKFFNAYTGLAETPALALGATAVAGTYAYGKYKMDTAAPTPGEDDVEYSGRIPMHGYEPPPDNMNATGDMVFGMHNKRKGG